MEQNKAFYYQACLAHDSRFDGVFFTGVVTTGIYCRPICSAKTPKMENCRFYNSAEAAEKASFRPCLRCRPELAPGNTPIENAHRMAYLITQQIEVGLLDNNSRLEHIAKQFQLSSRQIRRILQKEMGVSPIELLQTRRLLLAKQLLTETHLSMTEIAFASGFSSVRRFNASFQSRYRMAPSRLRKKTAGNTMDTPTNDTSVLRISYRPPYDWKGILNFLSMRMIKTVEWITEDSYARTVRLSGYAGWVRVTHAPEKQALMVEFTHSLTPVLSILLSRIRNLFDLNARPDVISAHLQKNLWLKRAVQKNPGLRVPGAFDGFELAIRAILGQQVTVKAATTLVSRLMEAFGKPLKTPFVELSREFPMPEEVVEFNPADIVKLGIVSARAKSMVALAKAHTFGELALESGVNPEQAMKQLLNIPGIGPWTANYIAMRALRWPDAFPKEDIAIRKHLGGLTAREAESLSQVWRPWRSYAVLHIWNGL